MPEEISFVKIEQSQFDDQSGSNYCCRLSFKLDPRQFGIKTVCVEFEEDFIADYFHVPGDDGNNYPIKLREAANKNRDFLFRLGLIKTEERINDQSLTKNIQISQADMSWAEKVNRKQLIPSSKEAGPGKFQFYPSRKIGFK